MSLNFAQTRGHDLKSFDEKSDDISESETGTSGWASCCDSREDLRDFVTKLGIKDVSNLYQDRFKVDRKKLELMLSGDTQASLPADIFFEQIMADTGTYITWPSKLKIGAKCKKDPHVRIAGRPDDVKVAKERVLTVLWTKPNRVTMKIDVSYTDHSHIIGRGGLSIKRIMEETHCHVHFPDLNRINPMEKSNQVSIAGDIQGVEKARSRVRQKTPVIFGFELPILSNNVDPKCMFIMNLQENYNVQVIFRIRPKLHATLVQVKGVQWEVEKVKEATMVLVNYICENLAGQTLIQMSMEISPHHHQMVTGNNHTNLKKIIKATGVQIMFPDAQDPNISTLKKSNITITGNVNNVYAASQMLIGSLPLLLMFNITENSSTIPTNSDKIMEIESTYGVTINVRQKPKQNTLFCIIKGHEKNAAHIYKARLAILGCDEPAIIADIPKSYIIPPTPTLPKLDLNRPAATTHNQPLLVISPVLTPTWTYAPPNTTMYHPYSLFNYSNVHQTMGSSGYQSMSQFSMNSMFTTDQNHEGISSTSGNHSNNTYGLSRNNMSGNINSSNLPSSTSLNESSFQKHSKHCSNYVNDASNTSVLSDIQPQGPYWTTTLEQEQKNPLADYKQKRISALKLIHGNKNVEGIRSPTNVWTGYGISQTSPVVTPTNLNAPTFDDKWKNDIKDYDYLTNLSTPNTSNLLDNSTASFIDRITSSKWQDVTSLLISIGLEKYIHVFTTNEIDLITLSDMNEKDLLSIGITAFGARNKLLLAISDMRSRGSKSFSPAPGAERKRISANLNTSFPKW